MKLPTQAAAIFRDPVRFAPGSTSGMGLQPSVDCGRIGGPCGQWQCNDGCMCGPCLDDKGTCVCAGASLVHIVATSAVSEPHMQRKRSR